jgi:hypothetical protein
MNATLRALLRRVLPVTLIGLVGAAFAVTPARAATADLWGYGESNQPVPVGWTPLLHEWGSWKPAHPADAAQVMRIAAGRYLVRFPWLASGDRGVVHVSPIGNSPRWCTPVLLFSAGADKMVRVECAGPGGAPIDSKFTVLFTSSSGVLPAGVGAHAYVRYDAGLVDSYNSTGAVNLAVPIAPGKYRVTLPKVGQAVARSGNLQVTAASSVGMPRRCKLANWLPVGVNVTAEVQCYAPGGIPAVSAFSLSYHRERAVTGELAPPNSFGYDWTSGFGPTSYNSAFAANSVAFVFGIYQVDMPDILGPRPHVQFTSYGPGTGYCIFWDPWFNPVIDDVRFRLICYDNALMPAAGEFLVSYTAAF